MKSIERQMSDEETQELYIVRAKEENTLIRIEIYNFCGKHRV